MADPRDFLLNTDYELDKIILVETGSFVNTKTIPHSLGFIPLPFGVWSTDENFSSVNSIGVEDSSAEAGYTPKLGVNCTAYSDRLELTASGDGSATTTIYYRLYAFEHSDSQATIPTNSDLAKTFILNTDYNYRKLKATGSFTQDNEEYSHDLGYIPQVMAWIKYKANMGGGVQPLMSASEYTNIKLTVTNSKLIAGEVVNAFTEKIYWRIYYDEA